jgi:hypothetical protein
MMSVVVDDGPAVAGPRWRELVIGPLQRAPL